MKQDPKYIDFTELVDTGSKEFSLMLEHLRLVGEANKHINLTSIKEPEQALYLHAYDSLLGLSWLDSANEGAFADIGSGAGFPGIPLALFSRRNASLIESMKKKAALLNGFVEHLGLQSHIEVLPRRAEHVANEVGEAYTAICVRAVSSLVSLMELASPLLMLGGLLLAYKGPNVDQEVEDSCKVESLLGLSIEACESFTIPRFEVERRIIIARKVAEPQVRLPRRDGKAQRDPFS